MTLPVPALTQQTLQIERLEFGKLCLSAEGAIAQAAGYRQIACSSGFPAELKPACYPTEIGLDDGILGAVRKEGWPRVSVLQPNRISSAYPTLFCMARSRPEDGETGAMRLFAMARFAAGGPACDPFTLYQAASSLPFYPLTAAGLSRDFEMHAPPAPVLSAWKVHDPARSMTEAGSLDKIEGLVVRILHYALSGIPVALEGFLAEEDFFRLVTAVWWALPQGLRPLLSAAWGTPGWAGTDYTVSASMKPAETAARYSLAHGTWRDPQRIIQWPRGRRTETAWRPEALELGRAGADPAAVKLFEDRLPQYLAPHFKDQHPLPKFNEAATWNCFRVPGLLAIDALRLGKIHAWTESEPANANFDTGWLAFEYPAYAFSAVTPLVEILKDPARRPVAQQMLIRLLEGPHRDAVIKAYRKLSSESRAYAQLLFDLTIGSPDAILHSFREAVEAGQGWALPQHLYSSLAKGLEQKLQRPGRQEIRDFVALMNFPWTDEFAHWLRSARNGFLLGATLLANAPGTEKLARAAIECAPSAENAVLRRWLEKAPPEPQDQAIIAELPEIPRSRFTELVESTWNGSHAEDIAAVREQIWPWAVQFYSQPHALLGLTRPDWMFQGERCLPQLVQEVVQHRIPGILREKIAAVCLRRWSEISPEVSKRPAAWKPVLASLPYAIQRLLRTGQPAVSGNAGTHSLEVLPNPAALETILTDWAIAKEKFPQDCAATLKTWLRGYNDPQTLLYRAAICRAYLLGYTVPVKQDDTVIEHCAWLLPQIVPALDADAMWRYADTRSKIRLALQTFPEYVFQPDPGQEILLVQDCEWLRRHLEHLSTSRAQRNGLLLYTCKFLSVEPGAKGPLEWKAEYSARPCIWAAFKGLPLSKQGNLAKALSAYTTGRNGRAELCLQYIRAAPESAEALARVLQAFVAREFSCALKTVARWVKGVLRGYPVEINGGEGRMIPPIWKMRRSVTLASWESSFINSAIRTVSPEIWEQAFQLCRRRRG